MKMVNVRTSNLVDGLKKVGYVKNRRSEISKGFTLRVTEDQLELLKTDLNDIISHSIKVNNLNDDFVVNINDYNKVFKAIKLMKGKITKIIYNTKDDVIKISDGQKSMEFKNEGRDFMQPKVDKLESHIYSSQKLLDRLNEIDYATDKNNIRQILAGVTFNNNDIVALDGYRLALSKDDELNFKSQFIISNDSIENIKRLLRDNKTKDIQLSISNARFIIEIEDTKLYSRLVEGRPFNYSDIIRDKTKDDKSYNIDKKIILDSIKYLASLSDSTGKAKDRASGNIIKLKQLDSDNIEFVYNTSSGVFKSQLAVENNKLDYTIGVNVHYLLDAINKIQCDRINLGLMGEHNPLMLRGNNSIHLVLPVRLANKEELI